jgi:hypothetical protein
MSNYSYLTGYVWRPKTREELEAMSPQERAVHGAAEAELVFGAGFKRDAAGKPIETGIGSLHNETMQSRMALQLAEERKKQLRSAAGVGDGTAIEGQLIVNGKIMKVHLVEEAGAATA